MVELGERILEDKVISFTGGRLIIHDCIFEYSNDKLDICIQGDVNPDLSAKYDKIDSDLFSITLGESRILNEVFEETYTVYRLIDICF